MTEYKVQIKSPAGFVRSLSGLFITKDNLIGLSPRECTLLTAILLFVPRGTKIDKEAKIKLANLTNNQLQVTTNYINKLRKKNAIQGDQLHPVFYSNKVIINNGEGNL